MRSLLGIIAFGSVAAVLAQPCTPDPFYQDSLYGIWPDTTTNFVSGNVGSPYEQVLNLIVPEDAGVVDPTFAGVILDSVRFDGVTGLPPGLSVACASQTSAPCTYLTGVLGCGVIQGTPTQEGEYPLTLNVTAYTTLFGNTIPIAQEFGGYHITINGPAAIAETALFGSGSVRTVPNPFSVRTSIEFTMNRSADVRLRVFNLLGEEMWGQRVQGKVGTNRIPFESGSLPDGVYFYKVEGGKETFTGRMVLHR